ncbi:MAG: L-histidine N(alpha)-methyltransferase, partial [Pseudomonadales bacterium]|nr:L-histidine N(alpha)-methyltransferase [Pseudomonadales bacterium]
MNFNETGIFQKQKVRIKNLLPDIGIDQARKEIIEGLTSDQPKISSKYFYDEKGSVLFEEITKLEEYYPTETEKSILKRIAPDLMNRNSSLEIIELGSGDCSKISILLNAIDRLTLENVNYIPVDFSRSAIESSANQLTKKFPEMEISGYVADFIHQLDLIPHSEKPRIICFLGSTIGNFAKNEAKEILQNLSKGMLKGDSLLVGFDLVKPKRILHSAYNDSKGVTEKFNKNILNVVNEIIQSD